MVSNLLNLQQQGMSIPDFLGQLSSIQSKFNSVLPPEQTASAELNQQSKFFKVCALAALGPELNVVQEQILSSSTFLH